MKLRLTFLLTVLLAAVACRREPVDEGLGAQQIQFAGGAVTKGFLNSGGLNVTGTRVKVWDSLTGFTGNINGTEYTSTDSFIYIEDMVAYDGGAYWPYTTATHEYRWTRTGTHRFFGWLDYDKSYNNGAGMSTSSFFGSSPSLNTDASSASYLTMTTPTYSWQALSSVPQYDFVFAKHAVVRNAADKDYSTVELPTKHLFTAVSLAFKNSSTNSNVQITDINTIYEGNDLFLHKGYATVDFSSSDQDITPEYHLEGDVTKPFFSATPVSGISIVPGKTYDLLSGLDITSGETPRTYYMTWPLTLDQIAPRTVVDHDIFGDPIYAESDKILCITYRVNGGSPETSRIMFPSREWSAGTKTEITIEFTDKSIMMVSQVLPWDYNVRTMDFNGESVVVPDGGKVTIDDEVVRPDNATVYLTTSQPEVTCKLYISSLQGATLVITKVGPDPNYFIVEPSSMTITGQQLKFVVKPSALPTGGEERKINLSYSIELPSGREIDGNSEIRGNDHNYTFSRQ